MKKSLIIMVLLALISTDIYAKGGKSSSFGKWNYDKFGHASKRVTNTYSKIPPSSIIRYNHYPAYCKQYVHVSTKFHVRVKNWFRGIQLGLNGYAEMRATLGTASKSCGLPYNIARMDLYYDRSGHKRVINKSYIRATMRGVGAVHECYKAVGYAFTDTGIVLPDGYRGNISVRDAGYVSTGTPIGAPKAPTYPRSINVRDYGIDLEATGIPYVRNNIPIGWMLPGRIVGDRHTVSKIPYAGAIMNDEKGCYKVKGSFGSIKF